MTDVMLDISGLEKTYRLGRDNVHVLSGLDLTVSKGEMVAIMGPSGAGKTTLLNCISGIDTAEAGQVLVAGDEMTQRTEAERTLARRHDIGMVFQFFNLIPTLTVRENVALPFMIMKMNAQAQKDRVTHMLETVGLGHRADHYSFQLSGGEMQLVSIARALVHEPPLLLADEPTGNVNPAVGRNIMGILSQLAFDQGTAVLMVTHSPEHAAWADRVAFLKDGVIAGDLAQQRRKDDVAPVFDTLLELGI